MRELRTCDIRHRVKGKWSLERRLAALLIAVHRYGTKRAQTREELAWAATLYDNLRMALEAARTKGERDAS